MNYIFKPGFSTAQSVTTVSGRGVGMDVVRTNIEKMGAIIDIRSEQGTWCLFYYKDTKVLIEIRVGCVVFRVHDKYVLKTILLYYVDSNEKMD